MKKHYDFIYPGDQGCSDSQTGSLNGKKKKSIFLNPFVEHTCACSLLLKYHQGKLRKCSKKCVLSFPCLPSDVFLFLSKTVRFPDKKNWDFALSFLALLRSCFPGYSFIQTEAFVRSIWSWTEGKYYYSLMFWTDTNQASLCSAPAGFHVKLFPCSRGLTVPFFSTVIWVLGLHRAGLWAVLFREHSLPDSDWVHSWNPGALSGECSDFQWPSESEEGKQQLDLDPDCGQDTVQSSEIKVVWRKGTPPGTGWKKITVG